MIKQQVTIDDNGLIARLDQYSLIVEEESRTFLETVIAFILRLVKAFTPVGTTGLLRGSIFSETSGFTPNLRGVVSSPSPYVETIESGRTPGKRPPPPGSLVTWIQRKFGVDQFEAEKLEFAVARNIARFGFSSIPNGAQMFKKAFIQSQSFLRQQQDALGKRIKNRIEGN